MTADKRRFPRIVLGQLAQDLKALANAKVVKLDGQACDLDVFDLSYDSVAFTSPPRKYAVGDRLVIVLRLNDETDLDFTAEAARVAGQALAVNLVKVPAEKRLVLENFLKDKMIGLNTYLVAKEFYSREGFSHWYHGPNSTNFILWRAGDAITRAYLEMDEVVLVFDKGAWHMSSALREEKRAYEDYVMRFDGEAKKSPVDGRYFDKALNIIGQMLVSAPPYQRAVLQVLVAELKKHRGA